MGRKARRRGLPSVGGSVRRWQTTSMDLDDIRRAAIRLDGVAHRTPVLTSRTLDEHIGAEVYLKAEQFQRAGAFKFRGAYNAVAALDEESRARGVATTSSGNHAQALALAAKLWGVPATVVMPDDAPASKRAATEGYGAEVVGYDRYHQDRDALAAEVAAERGAVLIPPYDHPEVMAGQGTVALELIDETGPLDALVVCLGGGGLLAGCATAAAALSPGVRIFGVEPETGDDHRRSRAEGRRVSVGVPRTIADGQQTDAPGELTWPITNALVEDFVTVTDAEILDTMRFLFERMNVVVEPSGASALAALWSGRLELAGGRIGVTLSGGNIDLARLVSLFG